MPKQIFGFSIFGFLITMVRKIRNLARKWNQEKLRGVKFFNVLRLK